MTSVKLAPLGVNLSLELILNSLFYSDGIVSEKYSSGGRLIMASSLLKSLFSSLLNPLIMSCSVSLIEYQWVLELVIKEYQVPDSYVEIVKSTREKSEETYSVSSY